MKKSGWISKGILTAVLALFAQTAFAEEVTVTTYYPSPEGKYKKLQTTDETLLATDTGNVGIGTTSPVAKLDVNGQVKISGGAPGAGKVLTSDADGLASWGNASIIPKGVIVIWSGTLGTIPEGWALCDGENGTPNLQNKFILGLTSPNSPTYGAYGNHLHAGGGPLGPQPTGGSSTGNNIPYYVLAYIMKL